MNTSKSRSQTNFNAQPWNHQTMQTLKSSCASRNLCDSSPDALTNTEIGRKAVALPRCVLRRLQQIDNPQILCLNKIDSDFPVGQRHTEVRWTELQRKCFHNFHPIRSTNRPMTTGPFEIPFQEITPILNWTKIRSKPSCLDRQDRCRIHRRAAVEG